MKLWKLKIACTITNHISPTRCTMHWAGDPITTSRSHEHKLLFETMATPSITHLPIESSSLLQRIDSLRTEPQATSSDLPAMLSSHRPGVWSRNETSAWRSINTAREIGGSWVKIFLRSRVLSKKVLFEIVEIGPPDVNGDQIRSHILFHYYLPIASSKLQAPYELMRMSTTGYQGQSCSHLESSKYGAWTTCAECYSQPSTSGLIY